MSTNQKPKKPPVVRRGQKKPYVRVTEAERQEIVEFVARLRVKRLTKTEIHKAIKSKFNKEWRMVDIYIARADAFLRQNARMTKDEAKDFGVNVLLDVIRTGKPSERTAAERRVAEIFGYNAPSHLRVGDPHGKPLAPAVIAPVVQFIVPDNGRHKKTNASGDSKS